MASGEDRLRLALALTMEVRDRGRAFERVLELVPRVPDEAERDLVVAALLAFGDKGLGQEERKRLREELRQVSKIAQELYEEGREEGRKEERLAFAKRLLEMGDSVEKVAKVSGLSIEDVEQLLKKRQN